MKTGQEYLPNFVVHNNLLPQREQLTTLLDSRSFLSHFFAILAEISKKFPE